MTRQRPITEAEKCKQGPIFEIREESRGSRVDIKNKSRSVRIIRSHRKCVLKPVKFQSNLIAGLRSAEQPHEVAERQAQRLSIEAESCCFGVVEAVRGH